MTILNCAVPVKAHWLMLKPLAFTWHLQFLRLQIEQIPYQGGKCLSNVQDTYSSDTLYLCCGIMPKAIFFLAQQALSRVCWKIPQLVLKVGILSRSSQVTLFST